MIRERPCLTCTHLKISNKDLAFIKLTNNIYKEVPVKCTNPEAIKDRETGWPVYADKEWLEEPCACWETTK